VHVSTTLNKEHYNKIKKNLNSIQNIMGEYFREYQSWRYRSIMPSGHNKGGRLPLHANIPIQKKAVAEW
jgi:hypothetical protein